MGNPRMEFFQGFFHGFHQHEWRFHGKTMENYGKLRKTMENYGNYIKLWKTMENMENWCPFPIEMRTNPAGDGAIPSSGIGNPPFADHFRKSSIHFP